MWMINGQVTRWRRWFTANEGKRYPGRVLSDWSKEQLAAIGVVPFREVSFDKDTLRSTGHSDAEVNGEIVRTHTTEPIPAEILEIRDRSRRISENRIIDVLVKQMIADKLGGKSLIPVANALLADLKAEKDYRDALEAAMLAAQEEII